MVIHLQLQDDPEEEVDVAGVGVHDDVEDILLLYFSQHCTVVGWVGLSYVDLKVFRGG